MNAVNVYILSNNNFDNGLFLFPFDKSAVLVDVQNPSPAVIRQLTEKHGDVMLLAVETVQGLNREKKFLKILNPSDCSYYPTESNFRIMTGFNFAFSTDSSYREITGEDYPLPLLNRVEFCK